MSLQEELLRWWSDMIHYGLEKFGLYYSQYRGFVADNNDPEGLGRLQVLVPEIHGEIVPNIWAWPMSRFSGVGYGAQVIPRKNDFVWVSFEKGNTRKPTWTHGYFGKNMIPTELQGNHLYWFRTPAGLTILIDNKEGTITLYQKDGSIQPMVLADTLNDKLDKLIDIMKTMKINTQLGPQSILPFYTQQLDSLKKELKEFKSKVNKLS